MRVLRKVPLHGHPLQYRHGVVILPSGPAPGHEVVVDKGFLYPS